jgi:hypothetical protein
MILSAGARQFYALIGRQPCIGFVNLQFTINIPNEAIDEAYGSIARKGRKSCKYVIIQIYSYNLNMTENPFIALTW